MGALCPIEDQAEEELKVDESGYQPPKEEQKSGGGDGVDAGGVDNKPPDTSVGDDEKKDDAAPNNFLSQSNKEAKSQMKELNNHKPLIQKISKPPSTILLLWLHLTHLFIWYCQCQLPRIALNSTNHYNHYCESKYFNGYNSPNCTDTELSLCYSDSECTLKHDFFGYDNHFFCKSTSDCEDCECVSARRYHDIMITLCVFLGIGAVLEIVRFFMAMVIICSTMHENGNQLFISSIADGIQLRAVQIMNPKKYKANIIGIQYNQHTIFTFKSIIRPWHTMDFFLHQLPVYVCAFVLLAYDAFKEEKCYQTLLIFASLIVYVLNQILKIRFSNAAQLQKAPEYIAPEIITQTAKVIASYIAVGNDQLSINRGDNVTVMGQANNFGWVLVSNASGQSGYVPFEYLQIVQCKTRKAGKKDSLLNEIEGDPRAGLLKNQNIFGKTVNYVQSETTIN